jgi:chemotaxis protein CheD
MENIIKVGMADYKTANCPSALTTIGLGSCIGIAIYDTKTKIIGLAHIMLPSSDLLKSGGVRAKYADTCIADMIDEMVRNGSDIRSMKAKIAGGAQMFAYNSNNDLMRVGPRNADACKAVLASYRIPLIGEDTGGNHGRTIEFYSVDGRLMIKTIGHGVAYI